MLAITSCVIIALLAPKVNLLFLIYLYFWLPIIKYIRLKHCIYGCQPTFWVFWFINLEYLWRCHINIHPSSLSIKHYWLHFSCFLSCISTGHQSIAKYTLFLYCRPNENCPIFQETAFHHRKEPVVVAHKILHCAANRSFTVRIICIGRKN